VNVRNSRWREIVINHHIDALEIDTSAHQLGANEYPDFAHPEHFYNVVSLNNAKVRKGKVKNE
jgi:hypothetical protein